MVGLIFCTILCAALSAQNTADQQLPLYHYAHRITRQDLRKYVELLASDSLEGRGFGTIGSMKAGEFIANMLKEENLVPVGDRQTFFQPVVVNKWQRDKSHFEGTEKRNTPKNLLTPGTDFVFNLTEIPATLQLSGDHYMFAGYGIDDPAYNDYLYAQVRDEVLLMMDGEPHDGKQYMIGKSSLPSQWSNDLNKKIKVAAQKGAKAVILIMDSTKYTHIDPEVFKRVSLFANEINCKFPIPVIRLNESALPKLLSGKEYKRIIKLMKGAKKGKVSSNYIIGNFKIDFTITPTTVRDRNIVGVIEGSDPKLKNEYIALSAHFDHLGVRDSVIYNGADDNGTGTAALISVSKALKALKDNGFPLKRSVLFLFCTGEESGLIGSKYFVKHPVVPLKDIKIDINVDMIGRSDELHDDGENYVYLIGPDKINPLLDKTIQESNARSIGYKLDYTYNDLHHPLRLYYRSDHYNFAEKGIPSVFLFGGFHEDYHKPTDDAFLINYKKVEDLSRLIFFTTISLANHPGEIKTMYKD